MHPHPDLARACGDPPGARAAALRAYLAHGTEHDARAQLDRVQALETRLCALEAALEARAELGNAPDR